MVEKESFTEALEAKAISEVTLPYPKNSLVKMAYKSPILIFRLGLGKIMGKIFMILTTTGRKSGMPRHTAIEYHDHDGHIYLYSAYGKKAQWYQNMLANPYVTIHTAKGVQSMIGRRITEDEELFKAFTFVEKNPIMRQWIQMLGMSLDRKTFIKNKDLFYLVTFGPTDQPTPPSIKADLWWVWLIVLGLIALLLIVFT